MLDDESQEVKDEAPPSDEPETIEAANGSFVTTLTREEENRLLKV